MPCSNCQWFYPDEWDEGECQSPDFLECVKCDSLYHKTLIAEPERFRCCFYSKKHTSNCPYEHHSEDCDCGGMGGDR